MNYFTKNFDDDSLEIFSKSYNVMTNISLRHDVYSYFRIGFPGLSSGSLVIIINDILLSMIKDESLVKYIEVYKEKEEESGG